MDAFYASIEQRDNAHLKNKPIVIGYRVATTSNYIARKSGIKVGMLSSEIKKIRPDTVFITPRVSYYFSVGKQIQNYLKQYLNILMFVASDEGYIDITENIKKMLSTETQESAIEKFILNFQKRIYEKFQLTCSVGIGYSMLSAKVASDINKPQGHHIFRDTDEFVRYVKDKPLEIIPGIGKKSIETLNKVGIKTPNDFFNAKLNMLNNLFPSTRVEDMRALLSGVREDRLFEYNKNISREKTLSISEMDRSILKKEIKGVCEKLFDAIIKIDKRPQTITLKLRYDSFLTVTNSKSFNKEIKVVNDIYDDIVKIFDEIELEDSIRLVGVGFSNFTNKQLAQTLF